MTGGQCRVAGRPVLPVRRLPAHPLRPLRCEEAQAAEGEAGGGRGRVDGTETAGKEGKKESCGIKSQELTFAYPRIKPVSFSLVWSEG